MNIVTSESVWLNDHGVCSAEHLIEVSDLSIEELDELIEHGLIRPVGDNAQAPSFQLHYVVTARVARRLRDDFELDRNGLVLALTLMRRIDELQGKLDALSARFDYPVTK